MSSNTCFYLRPLTKFSWAARHATAITIFLLLPCGCSRTLEFRAVDASTGAPLPGVRVERESRSDSVFFGSERSAGSLPPSGPDGAVVARGLSGMMVHRFIFSKDGYSNAEVIWELPEPAHLLYVSPFRPGETTAATEISSKGVVTVKMYR